MLLDESLTNNENNTPKLETSPNKQVQSEIKSNESLEKVSAVNTDTLATPTTTTTTIESTSAINPSSTLKEDSQKASNEDSMSIKETLANAVFPNVLTNVF